MDDYSWRRWRLLGGSWSNTVYCLHWLVASGYCTHSQFTMHASNDSMNDDDSVSDEEDDDVDAVLLLKGCLLHKQSVWEGVWSSSLYNIMYGVVLPCMVW